MMQYLMLIIIRFCTGTITDLYNYFPNLLIYKCRVEYRPDERALHASASLAEVGELRMASRGESAVDGARAALRAAREGAGRIGEDIPASAAARRDYDAEGRALISSLASVGSQGRYNPLDVIWMDKETGGKIYVGNQQAAQGPESKLASLGITHVVNCTDVCSLFLPATLSLHERVQS